MMSACMAVSVRELRTAVREWACCKSDWKLQGNTNTQLKLLVVRLTQVNEGESISFIYTICLYHGFAIHSVISLLLTKTFNTFTNTEIV